jgi:hypothetical protein
VIRFWSGRDDDGQGYSSVLFRRDRLIGEPLPERERRSGQRVCYRDQGAIHSIRYLDKMSATFL